MPFNLTLNGPKMPEESQSPHRPSAVGEGVKVETRHMGCQVTRPGIAELMGGEWLGVPQSPRTPCMQNRGAFLASFLGIPNAVSDIGKTTSGIRAIAQQVGHLL